MWQHLTISAMLLGEDVNGTFPVLLGIKSSPFFDKHGNLVVRDGYHTASGYYLHSGGTLRVGEIPTQPSSNDALGARELLLREVFPDFPFDDDTGGKASRAHTIALLLQLFMREMISKATPIYLVTKPAPGTGAGRLVDSVMMIGTAFPGRAQSA
jgi:hypothetical protein